MARHPAVALPHLPAAHAPTFSFGDLLWAARTAHPEFRNRERLEERLGWPSRKSQWLEHDRIQPTAKDLAQLRETLPLLRLLLEHARPEPRAIETWRIT